MMRLLVVGRRKPHAARVIRRFVQETEIERVIGLTNTGLAAEAALIAADRGITVCWFPPDYRNLGVEAHRDATITALRLGRPNVAIGLHCSDSDYDVLDMASEAGVNVLAGRCSHTGKLDLDGYVPANRPPRRSAPDTRKSSTSERMGLGTSTPAGE